MSKEPKAQRCISWLVRAMFASRWAYFLLWIEAMPRGRIVLKRICESRKLATLKTDGARLLFTWLIPNVDVNGCFSGDPEVVKGKIFTRLKKSTNTVEKYLQDLHNEGLIVRYNTNGDDYLYIINFEEHQPHINPEREGKTDIPTPTPEQLQSKSRASPPQIEIESKVKVKKKEKYKDFVFLTNEEYSSLLSRFGEIELNERLAALNDYIGSSGKKYKSHYHTILTWARKNGAGKATAAKKTKLFPISGKKCSVCPMPAVYKDTSGSYDSYACADHMPAAVKAKYE